MRITTTDGIKTVSIDFVDVEECLTYLRLRDQMGLTDVVFSLISGRSAESERDDDADEAEMSAPIAVTGPRRKRPKRIYTPNPPPPPGRWPELIYLTQAMKDVLDCLRRYPNDALNYRELAIEMNIAEILASQRAGALFRLSPLVMRDTEGYRLTEIGKDQSLRFSIVAYPSAFNKKLGWDRFMALPLPGGPHRSAKNRRQA